MCLLVVATPVAAPAPPPWLVALRGWGARPSAPNVAPHEGASMKNDTTLPRRDGSE
jgi:hypothetical protein